MREASRTIAIMVLGAVLGIAGFVAIDRSTRTNYEPPAFEQVVSKPEPPLVADPAPRAADRAPSAGSHAYRYCSEAQADGATPMYVGQPGYNPRLDGDHDGIACERW